MVCNGNNSDAQSSGGQSKLPSGDESRLKSFIRSMLVSSLFVGTFVEKRFVPSLNEYRHIIKVSEAESDFISHLKVSKKKIKQFYGDKKWIGITDALCLGSPVGYSIWTTLSEEMFGTYWFKIKGVQFYHNEVKLRVSVVRPYLRECEIDSSVQGCSMELNDSLESLNKKFTLSVKYLFSEVITFKNVFDAVVFLSLLLASLLTGGVRIIQYLLEYILKLAKTMNEMIVALTPAWIALVNASCNVIFGLYRLLAFLLKQENKNVTLVVDSQNQRYLNPPARYALTNVPQARYTPVYYNNRYRRSNEGVRITELYLNPPARYALTDVPQARYTPVYYNNRYRRSNEGVRITEL